MSWKTILFSVSLLTSSFAGEFEGLLFPASQVVLSTLAGGVVVSLPFREGQYVPAGSVLLAQDAIKDSLNLLLSRRNLERSRIEESQEMENEIAFSLKEISYKEKFIYAPFSGTIVKMIARQHEYYPPGTKVIELADLSQLSTQIHIPFSELTRIRKRETVITVLKDKDETKGELFSFIPLAEPGTEVFPVTIHLRNKFRWSPGTTVKIRF